MFENILNQSDVVERLTKDLSEHTLPPSILFSGPLYSGKLSTALELARVLSCEERTAEWNCPCKSCESHRVLLHPNTLLLGGRYFMAEIAACADTLSRIRNASAQYLFIRSIRKLTRRFDPVLWEGEEAKVAKLAPLVSALEEIAYDLSPGGAPLPETAILGKRLEEALDTARKLEDSVSLGTIPVGMVRRVGVWAHLKGAESRKVIIIENADRLLDSARNALLKLLEEPPPEVHFILLSSRRNAIIPTILSRVRTYPFKRREGRTGREVLERIFRETSGEYPDLDSFFLIFQGVKPSTLRASTIQFIRNAWEGKDFLLEDLFQDREKFRLFLIELLSVLSETLRGEAWAGGGNPPPLTALEEWMSLVRKTAESVEVLNVHPVLMAERLFVRIRRAHA